ncbi:hypothetical protein Scep_010105 [Stephania cephalantha]|uniref:Uncharacterized protein n=1 Tax=Stephania cephalantha TaxID=152367 RepID=A0AAP0PEW9_9MAGN
MQSLYETDLKNVVDAFFLGKALAEVISERVESTVGELLNYDCCQRTILILLLMPQLDTLKNFTKLSVVLLEKSGTCLHVHIEEVLERAKREKGKAARESLEAQGVVPKPTLVTVETIDISSEVPFSPTSQMTLEVSSTLSAATAATSSGDPNENDPTSIY